MPPCSTPGDRAKASCQLNCGGARPYEYELVLIAPLGPGIGMAGDDRLEDYVETRGGRVACTGPSGTRIRHAVAGAGLRPLVL